MTHTGSMNPLMNSERSTDYKAIKKLRKKERKKRKNNITYHVSCVTCHQSPALQISQFTLQPEATSPRGMGPAGGENEGKTDKHHNI